MRVSEAPRAKAEPLTHSVDAEGRHWNHGCPASFGGHALPPVQTRPHPPADGTGHVLRAFGGTEAVFAWERPQSDSEGIWVPRERMARMAFTPEHLGSLGWTYVRPYAGDPSEPEKPAPPRRSQRAAEEE